MENKDSSNISPINPNPNLGKVPSSKVNKVWKVLTVVLALVVIIFILLIWWGYRIQQKEQLTNNQNDIMTQFEYQDVQILTDFSNDAYTVYLAYPSETTEQQIQEFKDQYSVDGLDFTIMPLEQFVAISKTNITGRIIINEYPEIDVTKGIMEFLATYSGAPIGLTWNGGIAFTGNDYIHAESIYKQYKTNPTGNYRPLDRRADPIHPLNHFDPLLGE